MGGTRFVGRHLAVDLLARGHRVSVLNRGRTPDDLPPTVERLRADRTRPDELRRAVTGRRFDAVVDMVAYREADARGAVEAFAGRAGHYVFVSSGQVYLVRTPPVEELAREEAYAGSVMPPPPASSRDHAEWLYGIGKRECEDVLREVFETRGFPATVLRLPMVNGERDNYQRVEGYVARARDGGPILVPAGFDRPLRHVAATDVVRIVGDLIQRGLGIGRVYNLAQDESVSLGEFLAVVGRELGTEIRRLAIPREVLEREGLLPDCSPFSERWMSILDNSRARQELGAQFTRPAEYLPDVVRFAASVPPERIAGYRQRPRELALVAA